MTTQKEIMSLPVQSPPTSEFSSSDLVWSEFEGRNGTIDRLCLIPFTRVDDFVRGESKKEDCPTRFHREASRKKDPTNPNAKLEFTLYWCSFGPDDHREGGNLRPSSSSSGRPRRDNKKGCCCHFLVKRLSATPTALILYNQNKHIDKRGLPCHSPQDKKAVKESHRLARESFSQARESARARVRERARNDGASKSSGSGKGEGDEGRGE